MDITSTGEGLRDWCERILESLKEGTYPCFLLLFFVLQLFYVFLRV